MSSVANLGIRSSRKFTRTVNQLRLYINNRCNHQYIHRRVMKLYRTFSTTSTQSYVSLGRYEAGSQKDSKQGLDLLNQMFHILEESDRKKLGQSQVEDSSESGDAEEDLGVEDVLVRVEALMTIGRHYHQQRLLSQAKTYYSRALKEVEVIENFRADYIHSAEIEEEEEVAKGQNIMKNNQKADTKTTALAKFGETNLVKNAPSWIRNMISGSTNSNKEKSQYKIPENESPEEKHARIRFSTVRWLQQLPISYFKSGIHTAIGLILCEETSVPTQTMESDSELNSESAQSQSKSEAANSQSLQDAEEHLQIALHLRKTLSELPRNSQFAGESHYIELSSLAESYNNLGCCLQRREKFEKALNYHDIAMNKLLQFYGQDENNRYCALTYYNLGLCKAQLGKNGMKDVQKACTIARAVFPQNDPFRIRVEEALQWYLSEVEDEEEIESELGPIKNSNDATNSNASSLSSDAVSERESSSERQSELPITVAKVKAEEINEPGVNNVNDDDVRSGTGSMNVKLKQTAN